MKSIFCTILSCFFLYSLNAQEVSQQESTMSLGSKTAFSVTVEGADKKQSEKTWEDYLKKYGKVKRNKKADEFFCEECNISPVSSSTLQVTMKLEERKDMTIISAWYDNGSAFISDETDEATAAKIETFMYEYGLELRKVVVGAELEEEEKGLKEVQKDLEKLQKTNKNLHEDIEKYKKKIAEAEADIEKNLKEQEDKSIEIDTQTGVVKKVTEKLNNIGKG